MTLNATSLNWAIDFVANHSDSDLFPKILEIEAIQALRSDFVKLMEGKDRRDSSVRTWYRKQTSACRPCFQLPLCSELTVWIIRKSDSLE